MLWLRLGKAEINIEKETKKQKLMLLSESRRQGQPP